MIEFTFATDPKLYKTYSNGMTVTQNIAVEIVTRLRHNGRSMGLWIVNNKPFLYSTNTTKFKTWWERGECWMINKTDKKVYRIGVFNQDISISEMLYELEVHEVFSKYG